MNQQNIEEILNYMDIKVDWHHTASGDALATAMIFQRSLAKLERREHGRLKDLVRTGIVYTI